MRRRVLPFVCAVVVALTLGGPAHSQGEPEEREPAPAAAAPKSSTRAPELEAAVRALVADKTLRDAQIGVVLLDVDTGAVLAQTNEHLALNPASNAKIVTAAAALAILHGSHRYQTTLNGTIKGNAVSGNLVLRGNGDPSLRTEDLWRLAQDLRGYGVRRVEGDIVVDQKFFDELTTPPAFEQQPNEWAAFRAPVSAVAVNENTVTMSVRPTAEGSPALVSFDPPGFVDVTGTVNTGEEGADSVILALSPNGRRLSAKVAGAVGSGAKLVRYTRRVDDPQLLAGYALRAMLEECGIKVTGEVKLGAPTGKTSVLAKHESDPLSTLLYALGKSSDNFYAEMIFKSIASEGKRRPGSSADSAELVSRWLERNGLSDKGVVVKNGSGLFDANRTTAHAMTRLLRHAWHDPEIRSEFVAQLAIGGVDGTLHKRLARTRPHRAVRAKTGTLEDAIALSGYVIGPPGKSTIAFSILFNKVSGRGASARAAADKLVELVYERQYR